MAHANVAVHLAEMAARRPDAAAILFAGRGAGKPTTYRELNDDCDRIARGLEQIGIGRGVRTAFFVRPSADFFALTFALFKVGAVPVMIDPGMGAKAVGTCVDEARPTGFIGIGKAHMARIALGWGKDTVAVKVSVGSRMGWGGHTLDAVRKLGGDGAYGMGETDPGDVAAILFTSGSTGPAKGAIYTHGMFSAQVEMLRDLYDIQPGEVDLPTFPLFALFDPALGMTTVVPQMDFANPGEAEPRNILDPIREYGVTQLFANPSLLRRVAEWGVAHDVKLPSLKRVLSAGAPVPPDVLEKTVSMLADGVEVFTPYGATEVLPVCSIGSAEVLGETARATRAGKGVCVGRPVPPNELAIIRITDDPIPTWADVEVLPPGEIGEVVVQGPTVTRAYLERPEQTALAKIAGGDTVRHRMGDVGYLDDLGRLWFCGRKSHRVRTKDGDLFTLQVEPLFGHVAAQCALVGVAAADATERPVLVVSRAELPRDGLRRRLESWEGWHARLRSEAATHELTRRIDTFLLYPRPFPVDPRHNAKIRREVLREWAAEQLR